MGIKQQYFGMMLALTISLSAQAGGFANSDKAGLLISGYDPVSYFQPGGPQQGLAGIQAKVEDRMYWFSSEQNKIEFLKSPAKYEPQFGGWCAYAVADSKSKVEVDPKSFLIQDGKLLLFYKGLWGNTREKWLHNKEKNPDSFLKEAEANWKDVKDKEP